MSKLVRSASWTEGFPLQVEVQWHGLGPLQIQLFRDEMSWLHAIRKVTRVPHPADRTIRVHRPMQMASLVPGIPPCRPRPSKHGISMSSCLELPNIPDTYPH